MKNGNWVPLDKALIKTLPKNRAYSYIEAMFSYTVDQDNDKEGSINGYAVLWGWSRNKVRKFLQEFRTVRGHIADKKGTGKGHLIRFVSNGLQGEEDRKRTGRGQEEDRKRDTTINPNPNPNKNTVFNFDDIWKRYPNKDSRGKAEKSFNKFITTEELFTSINKALDNYKEMLKAEIWRKPQSGSTWFNNWQDWIDYETPASNEKDYEIIIDGVSTPMTETEYKQWKVDNEK